MQAVSSAYRAEQKEYLREEGYIWVYLGVISKEAQAHGKANGAFAVYSSPQLATSTIKFEGYYAIPEENFKAFLRASVYDMPLPETFTLGAVTLLRYIKGL